MSSVGSLGVMKQRPGEKVAGAQLSGAGIGARRVQGPQQGLPLACRLERPRSRGGKGDRRVSKAGRNALNGRRPQKPVPDGCHAPSHGQRGPGGGSWGQARTCLGGLCRKTLEIWLRTDLYDDIRASRISGGPGNVCGAGGVRSMLIRRGLVRAV